MLAAYVNTASEIMIRIMCMTSSILYTNIIIRITAHDVRYRPTEIIILRIIMHDVKNAKNHRTLH